MQRAFSFGIAWLLACVGAGCGKEVSCPEGTGPRLGRCAVAAAAHPVDALVDPTEEDAVFPLAETCGDGVVDLGEDCDDGNLTAGDGCSAACFDETPGDPVSASLTLGSPFVHGASSMAPESALWAWEPVEGATHYELTLDGERQKNPESLRLSAVLSPGAHVLSVRACDDDDHCSAWTEHRTSVARFGDDLPRGLRGAERIVQKTALGHVIALGCDDCFVTPERGVRSLAEATATLERALARGADLVQFDAASIQGTLFASRTDEPMPGPRPTLASLLDAEALVKSNALVVLDVAEQAGLPASARPEDFAEALFALLDLRPALARNGRPFWVRADFERLGYLKALHAAAARHVVTGPYVRFVLEDAGAPVHDVYAPLQSGAAAPFLLDADFVDAVSLDYRLPDLPYRLERARQAGRAVVLAGVGGPGKADFGEAILPAFRELVDVVFTTYRVDQARALLSEGNTQAYVDARSIASAGATLQVQRLLPSGARDALAMEYSAQGGVAPPRIAHSESADLHLMPPYLQVDQAGALRTRATPGGSATDAPGALALLMGSLPLAAGQQLVAFPLLTSRFHFSVENETFSIRPALLAGSGEQTGLPAFVFSLRELSAACGKRSIAEAFDLRASHWLLAYCPDGTHWTVLLDGQCVLSQQAAVVPLPKQGVGVTLGASFNAGDLPALALQAAHVLALTVRGPEGVNP
jgi:cysteine-rich repeat protein